MKSSQTMNIVRPKNLTPVPNQPGPQVTPQPMTPAQKQIGQAGIKQSK